ncbi:MAG: ECF-type sigma factor [Planctomycetota bacterium]
MSIFDERELPDLSHEDWAQMVAELKVRARNLLRDKREQGIGSDSLVQSTVRKLWEKAKFDPELWKSDDEFFAFAYRCMENHLKDKISRSKSTRRGGGYGRRELTDEAFRIDCHSELSVVDFHLDLMHFASRKDPLFARIIEHRVYCQMSKKEIAKIENCGLRKVSFVLDWWKNVIETNWAV